MDELFAELKECTCIVQGREATAQQIIEKHVAKLFLANGAEVGSPSAQDLDTVAAEHKAADDTAGQ